jgi:hypothetical protein
MQRDRTIRVCVGFLQAERKDGRICAKEMAVLAT